MSMSPVFSPRDTAGTRAGISLHTFLTRLIWLCVLPLVLLAAVAEGGQDPVPDGKPHSTSLLQSLTEQERAWLREHPVIRVAQDPGWPPVEFVDEHGEPTGMAEDYLRLMEQRLGVKFERVRNLSWQEAYARMKRWEIDMTTSVTVTPERTEFWAFTKPYMRVPVVIVTHPDVTYIGDMRELAGKTIAVVEGYAVNDWIPRDFPDIRLRRVKTAQEGLETLQRGEVFAYIETMLVVDHYMARLGMTALKIVGQTPYVNVQSMAVRKDWAPLAGILDKALDSISKAERDTIYRKWLPIRYEKPFDSVLFWRMLALFTVILLGLAFWIRKLANEISRRKKAETASSESERRFARLFHEAPVPLCFVNKDGVLVDFNARFEQAFGYSHDDVPTLAEWWQLAYPDPAYRAWVQENWNAAVTHATRAGTDITPIEYRVTCKNGAQRIILISGITLGEDFLATFFDVTERKQTEAALRESREQLKMFIEHAPAALAMFDRDMRYLNVSQRWLADYGLVGTDILGRSHYEVFPEIPARWKDIHRRALAGEVIRAEEDPFERANGTVQWLRWEVRPWYCSEGLVGGIVVFSEDITERKQAEEALRLSEERLRAALDYARIGYWELARDGQALWSKQIYRMFGLPADFQPGPDRLCEVVHGSDCPAVIESLQHSLATGVEHHVEYRIIRQDDGVERWVECRGKPILGEDGLPEKLSGFIQDITERKQAEAEIHRLNADLEQRVLERTAELTAANLELDAFAYAVSHDLRGPLRAMSGFSHALAEDYGGQLQGEALRYLEQIDIASGRMSELIDGLLALSRSTRGEMRHDAVDLSALSQRLLAELAQGDPERRVEVEVEAGLEARGDGRMIEVVMRNLLGNAWKYGAHVAVPAIRVYAEEQDGVRRFCVADNGAGFDMAHAGKLFQPFQRLHRQDEFPGIGIGLATVQRIVHRHGGVIEARGEPGKGAVFCFSLAGKTGDGPPDEMETG